jgi:hypothetical protein
MDDAELLLGIVLREGGHRQCDARHGGNDRCG